MPLVVSMCAPPAPQALLLSCARILFASCVIVMAGPNRYFNMKSSSPSSMSQLFTSTGTNTSISAMSSSSRLLQMLHAPKLVFSTMRCAVGSARPARGS